MEQERRPAGLTASYLGRSQIFAGDEDGKKMTRGALVTGSTRRIVSGCSQADSAEPWAAVYVLPIAGAGVVASGIPGNTLQQCRLQRRRQRCAGGGGCLRVATGDWQVAGCGDEGCWRVERGGGGCSGDDDVWCQSQSP